MAKKRAAKRKAAAQADTAVENDENHENEETNSVENGDAGSSKSTSSGKKKKSVTTKAEQKNETPKSKAKSSKSKSDGEEDEDEEDYEVEKILDVNYKKNGKKEFLIRWKNYSAKHDTWEPEDNLSCDELITKFLEVQEKRDKEPRKDLRERPKTVTRYTAPGGRKSRRTAGNRKSYTEQEDEDDE